jgi:hypothetical protein
VILYLQSLSFFVHSQIKVFIIFITNHSNKDQNTEISRVEPTTRLLSWSCLLSIAILTDFHHDRINDNVERVVIISTVPLNSYNINAQVNLESKDGYKAKILMGWYAPKLAFA